MELSSILYRLFNEEVFHCSLDPKMEISWSTRLLTTAGYCEQRSKGVGEVRFTLC